MTRHVLTLTAGGGAELVEDGDVIWNSEDDESFRDEFPDETLSEADVEGILEYLVSDGVLDENEADVVDVEEESVDGGIVRTVGDDDERGYN